MATSSCFKGRGFIGRLRFFAISGSGSTAIIRFPSDRRCWIHRECMIGGAQHRTVDRNPHHEDRKAYLLTRGLKWRVRSSSNAQSGSTVRSPSHGLESPRSPLIVTTHGTLRSAGSPSDGSWYAGPTIVAHDRGPIAPQSGLICHEIEATIVITGSSRSDDRSWASIRLHDRINGLQNRAKKSSLQTCISLLFS